MSNAAYARIATAQAAVGAQYLRSGRYRLEVQSIRTKDGFKGLSAIAEVKVVTSERTQATEPTRPGLVTSYVENLSDTKKNGGGRFKAFLMALAGAEEHEVTPGFIAKFTEAKQAGAFLLVDCEVFPKTLPEKDGRPGKVIEGYRWSNVSPTDAELAAIESKRATAKLPPLTDALA
ncbi:hypothetical protein MYSTI_03247 [Myxococcus stipitatus DSM 14675]|uniref:Uncharacterized protein n=1 Tax=Myxococcus stipitatus (strain DSM 14675 / JCM 12634 / Mx s8) TaxID=1278073 RepID=L7UDN0_MYXSD|nr:hypothetical protein [Myxococcus stipitatus]AGC44559.1 hypothetical protein MYSTI_03247 [Myxococcus stipitatus DSM 14675]